MNFADNFTAADCRAQLLHNKNASLFPQAVECINDAVEAGKQHFAPFTASLDCGKMSYI